MSYNGFRKHTKKTAVGKLFIGGDSPLSVQSMTNVPSEDFDLLYAQIKELEQCGCNIVRMTVPNLESVTSLGKIKASDIQIPLVADIHFNYRLAIESAEAGADKIRINPGNIGDDGRVKEVVKACRRNRIPIRIGVNGGSLEKNILVKYGAPTAEALCESALFHALLLEKNDFDDIIISVKSSDVRTMIDAYTLLSEKCHYPLHLGVTEAGSEKYGLPKSFVGIGALLEKGIGDTIRVSLTGDPKREVEEGKRLLSALGLNEGNLVNIVSCPTCGRTKIDLIDIVKMLENRADEMKPSKKITVAVMGCAVNGPGEAREADIGIAGGEGDALLFKYGQAVRKISEENIISELIGEINRL